MPYPTNKSTKNAKLLKCAAISLIICLITALIATILILSLSPKVVYIIKSYHQNEYGNEEKPDPGFSTTSDKASNIDEYHDGNEDDVKPDPGPGAIADKASWGGQSARNFTFLQHPTHLVIISHTATPMCKDFLSCSKRVQALQSYHVAIRGLLDIGYNFLIGGDGNAYVGRGWDVTNIYRNDSIVISFIGDFVFDVVPRGMIDVAKRLLEEGVNTGKLARNYNLIGHNQTFRTLSPGENLYREIKIWPHFDSGLYFN